MRHVARSALVAMLWLVCMAHVGSPDVWYQGSAGPYDVLVHIEAPAVIPGIAVVNVRVDGSGVERVSAFADRFDATGGAPPADVAEPVAGQPGWYRTRLWIMTNGSYGVTVTVTGPAGAGSALVPLGAFPLQRLDFGSGLPLGLGAAGVFLLAGILTIIGAAVREAVLPPGVQPDSARRRRARRAMARGALVIALVLLGGWRWWRIEDARFERSLFRPLAAAVSVRGSDLELTIEDSTWTRQQRGDATGRVATDHGKIMHLFLIDRTGYAFAHLHPTTPDSVRFIASLPPLPAGRYAVFGDIVQQSGFAQTLVATVVLPRGASLGVGAPGDPDDSWAVRERAPAGDTAALPDGSTLTWLRGSAPIRAGEEARLRFEVTPPPDDDAPLEPYMGMLGHAVVVEDDASVFVHLHPMGSISTAAQIRLGGGMAMNAAPAGNTIAFPLFVPGAGTLSRLGADEAERPGADRSVRCRRGAGVGSRRLSHWTLAADRGDRLERRGERAAGDRTGPLAPPCQAHPERRSERATTRRPQENLGHPGRSGPYLERMGLADPQGLEERVLRRAVVYGLAAEDVI